MNLIENDGAEHLKFIWVDENILNIDNRIKCGDLKTHYEKSFQAFENIPDFLTILPKIKDKEVTILTSAQCAYQLVKHTKHKMIMLCNTKFDHLDLFLHNNQIKSIVSNSFQSAHKDVIMCMNYTDIQDDFIKLLSPPQKQTIEYQHSKNHVSIQFLVVLDYIRKNKEPKEQDIYDEIDVLLAISNKQNKKQSILEDLKKKEIEKEKSLKEKFNFFDKFIYLYNREEIHQIFNQQFALYNYQKIKNIILCLYQGFKQYQSKEYNFQCLYRGISFDSKEIFDTIIQDLESSKKTDQRERTSLFWNTIASTSLLPNIAYNFASNGKYGIVYKIVLDQQVPHPYFQLSAYHSQYPIKEEVLLFPQFEFIVQKIYCIQVEPIKIYMVTVQQIKQQLCVCT